MGVEVPLSLLEDIFRLLSYLDKLGDCSGLPPHKPGHNRRFEHDTALWELRLKIRQLQGQAAETYLLTVHDVTEEEKRDLMEWVATGNSAYDNPYSLYDDSGCLMDFINGRRISIEMAEDYPRFFGAKPDDLSGGDGDDEPPFLIL
jgi:hypothetical protein